MDQREQEMSSNAPAGPKSDPGFLTYAVREAIAWQNEKANRIVDRPRARTVRNALGPLHPSRRAPKAASASHRAYRSAKNPFPTNGTAYAFRHAELGLLGRLILQDMTGANCHLSLELAGDPDDPMTAKRATLSKLLGMELANRLEQQLGSAGSVQQTCW